MAALCPPHTWCPPTEGHHAHLPQVPFVQAYPWLANIAIIVNQTSGGQTAQARYDCTGTLIAPNAVLCAGHCVAAAAGGGSSTSSAVAIRVAFGLGSPSVAPEYWTASGYLLHPGFWDYTQAGGSIGNDLSLIFLPGASAIRPAPLDLTGKYGANLEAEAVGWGLRFKGASSSSSSSSASRGSTSTSTSENAAGTRRGGGASCARAVRKLGSRRAAR